MKKTKATETKKNVLAGAETNYIEETLKFVESEEMRKHLHKWLTSGSVRRLTEICADIVFNAPVPLEHKLPTLKLLSEHESHKSLYIEGYFQDVKRALDERYNSSEGMTYELSLCDEPDDFDEEPMKFKSFDEAVEHLKSLDEQAEGVDLEDADTKDRLLYSGVLTFDDVVLRHKARKQKTDDSKYEGHIVYTLSKHPLDVNENMVARWYLNEAGEVLYSDYYNDDIPGNLNLPVPFAAGDIVITDCRPFGHEQKVLILENLDTFDSVDGSSVPCIFINRYNNIDACHFKYIEFSDSVPAFISPLYRAKTFSGELSQFEAPLEVIRKVIANNPRLTREMFLCLNNFNMYASGENKYVKDSISRFKNYGIGWEAFKKGFGL